MNTARRPDLIPASFLFRLQSPLQYTKQAWNESGIELPPSYVLPSFDAELNGGPYFADLRIGWNEAGLLIQLVVAGKKQPPWCRDGRWVDSDGLQLLIDTRNTKEVHRATQYCHRFALLPAGIGRGLAEPIARAVKVDRAREEPKAIAADALRVRSERQPAGYRLEAYVPADALTGFDPIEHPVIGFNYVVVDRELGWQSYQLSHEMPHFLSDPNLWGALELQPSQ